MQKTFIGTLAAGWVGIILMFANSIVIADADKKLPEGKSLSKPGLHGPPLHAGREGRWEPRVPVVAETRLENFGRPKRMSELPRSGL